MGSGMGNKTIRVVARILSLPEKVEELTAILRALVEPTRKETGCISYQLLRNTSDVCDFVFVEEWASQSAIDTHLKTPHIQNAFAKAQSLLAKAPQIDTYSIVE